LIAADDHIDCCLNIHYSLDVIFRLSSLVTARQGLRVRFHIRPATNIYAGTALGVADSAVSGGRYRLNMCRRGPLLSGEPLAEIAAVRRTPC